MQIPPPLAPGEPPPEPPSDVTRDLKAWSDGDQEAGERLLAVVYDELRRQARRAMRRESPDHTLQPTELVNEVYLRLIDQRRVDWRNRAHFFGVSAQLMRRILVDHARRRKTGKRNNGMTAVSLSEIDVEGQVSASAQGVDIIALHEALERLSAMDPHLARLVELRYFGGLTIEQTAVALGIVPSTVKRQWEVARAWLLAELHPS